MMALDAFYLKFCFFVIISFEIFICVSSSTEGTVFVFAFLKNDCGSGNLIATVRNSNDNSASITVQSSFSSYKNSYSHVAPRSAVQVGDY